jgi:hypothetical protein
MDNVDDCLSLALVDDENFGEKVHEWILVDDVCSVLVVIVEWAAQWGIFKSPLLSQNISHILLQNSS